MKLKRIHIDSYKVFQNFEIDFCDEKSDTPQDIIVLAGVNGTGKTTLLEEVIHKRIAGDIDIPGGVIKDYNYASMRLPPHQSVLNDPTTAIPVGKYLPVGMDTTNLEEYVIRYVKKMVFENGKTSKAGYEQIQHLIDEVFAGMGLHIYFKGLTQNEELLFTNGNISEFGTDGLSSGEKQLLGKFFPLFAENVENTIILIDEPEESLHPAWQIYVLPILRRCAKKNNCQFILATHSPQIISSAHNEELRLLAFDKNNHVKAERCNEGPYGWRVEDVLREILGVTHFRVPEVDEQLNILRDKIQAKLYDTDEFIHLWTELEHTLGYSDSDLVLMRMEIARQRKKDEENQ
ncbi:MAG: AAA family ATPase [Prevotellaceae bacterium]|jgi:energy-coupling factor transporter ATP-binding protein EcfA2|nr:AAA family ATPase [Prevotellaceae bacterium]